MKKVRGMNGDEIGRIVNDAMLQSSTSAVSGAIGMVAMAMALNNFSRSLDGLGELIKELAAKESR